MIFLVVLSGEEKMVQNGQTESEGVCYTPRGEVCS